MLWSKSNAFPFLLLRMPLPHPSSYENLAFCTPRSALLIAEWDAVAGSMNLLIKPIRSLNVLSCMFVPYQL